MFHCHIEFHAEVGMSLIFKVGEHKDMLPVPNNFPSCGNWQPKDIPFKPSTVNILLNTTEIPNATVDKITENSIQQFIKVLPQVLRTLHMSSSASTSFISHICFFLFLITLL